jgi:Tol biopolymer transport system component
MSDNESFTEKLRGANECVAPERSMRCTSAACATLTATLLGAFGCGEGTVDPPPGDSPGSIRVVTQTSAATAGALLDPDGYTVVVDGLPPRTIELNGTVTFNNIAAGSHSAALGDLQVNCTTPRNPVAVTVAAGGTAEASFEITCRPPTTDRIVFGTNVRGMTWIPGQVAMEIYTINPDGTDLRQLTSVVNDYFPVWSPDGWRIAFTRIIDWTKQNIYVMNADGTGQTALTSHDGVDQFPAWSPDGSKIAFSSDRDADMALYLMNADGTGVVRLTENSSFFPSWLPDGSKIVFTCGWDVCTINPDGTGEVNLTNHQADEWAVGHASSPDGTRILFNRYHGDDNSDIYLMNVDGTDLVRLTNTLWYEETAGWSPDGTKILFTRNGHVHYMNADGTGIVGVTIAAGGSLNLYPDWSHGTGVVSAPVPTRR